MTTVWWTGSTLPTQPASRVHRLSRRVVVLTFWDPWEAPHGGTLRTRAFCDAFVALGDEVVCIFPAGQGATEAGRVGGVQRVPVQGDTVGHRRWPAVAQRIKRNLLPMPTATGARSSALAEALAAAAPFDVLIISHLSATQYHDAHADSLLWLDQSDLWSDFAEREVAARRGLARWTAERQRLSIVGREQEAARRADVVSAAGWTDAQALRERSGRDVVWLPTALPDVAARARPRSGPDRAAGYLANFAYHPNVDALEVLLERWLPGLRSEGWRLVVAGLQSESLDLPPDVTVLGRVGSVEEFYEQVDITLAPVRLGGGMKVKVIESLLRGRPVVASEFAVDGFPEALRSHAVVVDLDAPDLTVLSELGPVEVGDDWRRRFDPTGFTETVARALDGTEV